MKLAEALVLRADLQKRIEQVRERLKACALVQEGEEPAEDPQMLLAELEQLLAHLTEMVRRINRTNLAARLPNGKTLMEALASRDTFSLHHKVLETVAAAATPRFERLQRSEIKQVATVKVSDIRKQMDDLARQRRELDTLIQAANWTTELTE